MRNTTFSGANDAPGAFGAAGRAKAAVPDASASNKLLEEITGEAKAVCARWTKASNAAIQAGMQGPGDGESSFFEVRFI